ncbi:MAG: hypothetical protein FJ293_16925, partial [Planctomycetes bacterium]|nr:hypothetical protein [Planctomycetota bacterium]
ENEALTAGGPERPDRPRWIALALVGTGTQRDALGARATITAGGRRQVEEVRGASSYAAWNELALRFGLGGAASVEQVEIRWPDGRTSRHGPLAADRRHVLRQP